jgi:hypothetical protein
MEAEPGDILTMGLRSSAGRNTPLHRIRHRPGPDPAPPRFGIQSTLPGPFSTRKVQALRHNFDQHPLMQLPALVRLARSLSATKQCRFIKPGSGQASPFDRGDSDPQGRAVDEVFAPIETPGSWIAFYNVETDPAYRAFLDQVMASVRPLVEPREPGIFSVGGFIFIHAPPAVTPFHIDRENNFWLQIRGRKLKNVWDPGDRQVVSAPARNRFIVYAGLEELQLRDGFRERSQAFDVGPGDGVYFPSTRPHMTRCDPGWTTPGDGVSISIGVVFYTSVTRRAAYVHALNLQLRQLGWTPREPVEWVWADRLKFLLGRAVVSLKQRFRGYRPRVGL